MQDLEELRRSLSTMTFDSLTMAAIDLIRRLQAAEKDRNHLTIDLDGALHELKALREQKPVAWRKEHKVSIGVEYSYTSTFSHVEDWAAAGITLTPLYAAPVAQSRAGVMICDECFQEGVLRSVQNEQSRDSAEPVKAIPRKMTPSSIVPDDYRNSAEGYRAGWNDVLECIQSNPNYHIGNMVEAKQAVPDGWRLVPIEPTDEMLAEGWEIEVECHNHGKVPDTIYLGDFTAKECWSAMLAAAPQRADFSDPLPFIPWSKEAEFFNSAAPQPDIKQAVPHDLNLKLIEECLLAYRSYVINEYPDFADKVKAQIDLIAAPPPECPTADVFDCSGWKVCDSKPEGAAPEPINWPDPYASIEIDAVNGISVVDKPSYKTVEVWSKNQIELMMGAGSDGKIN